MSKVLYLFYHRQVCQRLYETQWTMTSIRRGGHQKIEPRLSSQHEAVEGSSSPARAIYLKLTFEEFNPSDALPNPQCERNEAELICRNC